MCVLVVFKWMKLFRACMTHCGCLIFLIRLCAGGDESRAFKIQFTSHIMSCRRVTQRHTRIMNCCWLPLDLKSRAPFRRRNCAIYLFIVYININVCSWHVSYIYLYASFIVYFIMEKFNSSCYKYIFCMRGSQPRICSLCVCVYACQSSHATI